MRNAIGLVLTIGVALTAMCLPRIIHGLDKGEAHLPAGNLVGDYHPVTRNLVVRGVLHREFLVERSVRDENGRLKEQRSFVPLVPPDWTASEPVHLVFSARAWPGYRLEELVAAPEQHGVLRDALWEGLP